MLWRSAANSASVCGRFTISNQDRGNGTGPRCSSSEASPETRCRKLDQAQSSARRTSFARSGFLPFFFSILHRAFAADGGERDRLQRRVGKVDQNWVLTSLQLNVGSSSESILEEGKGRKGDILLYLTWPKIIVDIRRQIRYTAYKAVSS